MALALDRIHRRRKSQRLRRAASYSIRAISNEQSVQRRSRDILAMCESSVNHPSALAAMTRRF
jgi:hypothetical protein